MRVKLERIAKKCHVNLVRDREKSFPGFGVYPHQADLVRLNFSPQKVSFKERVNK